MQLEADAVVDLLRERCAIDSGCALIGKLGQIVGLELNAIELLVAAKVLDFRLTLIAG